jgi:hypothetical protein
MGEPIQDLEELGRSLSVSPRHLLENITLHSIQLAPHLTDFVLVCRDDCFGVWNGGCIRHGGMELLQHTHRSLGWKVSTFSTQDLCSQWLFGL